MLHRLDVIDGGWGLSAIKEDVSSNNLRWRLDSHGGVAHLTGVPKRQTKEEKISKLYMFSVTFYFACSRLNKTATLMTRKYPKRLASSCFWELFSKKKTF